MESLLVAIDKHDYALALSQIDSLTKTAKDPLFPVYLNFMKVFIQYYAAIPAFLSSLSSVLVGITPDILHYNLNNLLHLCRGAGLNEYIATCLPKEVSLTYESFPHLCRYRLACQDYKGIEKLIIALDKQSETNLARNQVLLHMRWKESFALMLGRSQLSLFIDCSATQTILTKSARTLFKLAMTNFTKNFLPDFHLLDKTVPRGDTKCLESLHRQSPISILANIVEYDTFLSIITGINEQGVLPEFLLSLDQFTGVSYGPKLEDQQYGELLEQAVQRCGFAAKSLLGLDMSLSGSDAAAITSKVPPDSLLLKLYMVAPRTMITRSVLHKLQRMPIDVPPKAMWDTVYVDFWRLFVCDNVVDALDVCKIMNINFRLELDLIHFLRDGKEAALVRLESFNGFVAEFEEHKSILTGKDAYISVSKHSTDMLLKILFILCRTTYGNLDVLPFGFPEKIREEPLLSLQRDVNAAIKHLVRTVFDRILSKKQPIPTLLEMGKIVQELRFTEYGFELKNFANIVVYILNKEAQYRDNHILSLFAMYVDIVCKYTQFRWYIRRNGSIVLPSDGGMQMRDISNQNRDLMRPESGASAESIKLAQSAYMETFSLKALQNHMDIVATSVADFLYRGRNFNVMSDDTAITLTVAILITIMNLLQLPQFYEYSIKFNERCKTPRNRSASGSGASSATLHRKKSEDGQRASSPFTNLVFKRHTDTDDDCVGVGVVSRHVSLSNDCFRSIDKAFNALIEITNNLYEHLHEIFCSQKGLADSYPNVVLSLMVLKQRMRTMNVERWKSALEEEALYNFFDIANQQYQVFGSFFWRWYFERGIITKKPVHTIVSGVGDMAMEDKRWVAKPEDGSNRPTRHKSSQTRRVPQKMTGDAPLGTCLNPLCFPGQFIHVRRAAQVSAVPFGFLPLIQGAAQYGRELVTTVYQSFGSSMLEFINPCATFDALTACARIQVSSAYVLSDSLEVVYKWMGVCLGYRNLKKANLIGLFIGLAGVLSGTGEPYIRYTRNKHHLIDSLDINGFAPYRHLFEDGGYLRDENLGAAYRCSGSLPDTSFLTPTQDIAALHAQRVETTLPLSHIIPSSNIWRHYLSTQPSLSAKSLVLNPAILAMKLPVVLSRNESFSTLLNYSIGLFLRGKDSVFMRRLPRSDAIATFLIYHICSYIFLLMQEADQAVINIAKNEITTVFYDLEFLLQSKVSSDFDLANKAHVEFFDYHGFTQRLPPLDLLFSVPLLKYWLERLGALTVALPIASEVVIRSCDLALTVPLIILIVSAIIFKERGLVDDVQTNVDALIECISRKTVDDSVEPTRQLCLACLYNILRFQV